MKSLKIKRKYTRKIYWSWRKNNKKYSAEIITGKDILVFETLNLEMTDGQIEKSLKKINNDEFGINIVKDKLGNKPYYKIYLIEANIGS